MLTLKLALGLGAKCRFLALPVAVGGLTQRRAVWLRGHTRGAAYSRTAHCLALRAVVLLAHVLWATNTALGLFAFHCALSARKLFALHLALRSLADRVANRRAHWVIALPSTFRMTLRGIRGTNQRQESQ